MSESIESLTESISDALQLCLDNGLELPCILAVITVNGSVLVIRTDGESPEVLAEHVEDGRFEVPINILVTDQKGDAARILIGPQGEPQLVN